MKPQSQFQYYHVRNINSGFCLEFLDMKEFAKFAEHNHYKTIFLLSNEKKEATHFALSHQGGLLQQPMLGFKSLEDFLASAQEQFPDAATYYEALERGYQHYDEYALVKLAGISDFKVFETMRDDGYIKGFPEYSKERETNSSLPDIGTVTNPYELYEIGNGKSFHDFAEFFDALKKGFTNCDTYRIAVEKGFKSKADYEHATKAGFRTGSDLEKARELKVRDIDDFQRFVELQFLHDTGYTYDKRVLLVLVSKLPQNKKVSINKMDELFKNALEAYRYTDTKEMPPWLTVSLNTHADMIEFLSTSDNIKRYGVYDHDGEFFETNYLRNRKVVIDASNVAHNSKGNHTPKPELANIFRLIEELKRREFVEITVIADASLRHKITDKELLPKLKETVEYLEAPTEKPADIFIINYVKRHRCLLISNDTFKDWKAQDAWIAVNIDFYRLSFMINRESVLLPDLN